MSQSRVVYWEGRPVEELSREELMDALNVMASLFRSEVERHKASLDLFSPRHAKHPANTLDAG